MLDSTVVNYKDGRKERMMVAIKLHVLRWADTNSQKDTQPLGSPLKVITLCKNIIALSEFLNNFFNSWKKINFNTEKYCEYIQRQHFFFLIPESQTTKAG